MKQKHRIYALSALIAVFTVTGAAQERGQWRAASNNARSITGDVAFTGEKISINFTSYTIAQIRPLTPAEAGALFNADSNAAGTGNLYRVVIPATKQFLHHNTLCGDAETDWVVTYSIGHTLQLAIFSDPKLPDLTAEGLANGSRLCGTYTYVR